MTKRILLMMIGLVMVSGCATVDTKHFGKVSEVAVKYDVPLYFSKPSAAYPYRDLGPVSGEDTMAIFDEKIDSISQALKNMSGNAKAMGANAVIEVKNVDPKWKQAVCQGEAVVFDHLPPGK